MTTGIQPRLLDIMTAGLLFYDPALGQDCYDFCHLRHIDCLPDLADDAVFWQRDDERKDFSRGLLDDDRRLAGDAPLFGPALLERFRSHPVQFVFAHGGLAGVVHFSDYNKDVVSTYLYAQIAGYERALRDLATRSNLTHDDMLDYLDGRRAAAATAQDRNYYNGRGERLLGKAKKWRNAPRFQPFELRDLIGLVKAMLDIDLADGVTELRNAVMHANRLVDRVDEQTDDYIYDFASFERFFTPALALLRDNRRVRNRLMFMTNSTQGEP